MDSAVVPIGPRLTVMKNGAQYSSSGCCECGADTHSCALQQKPANHSRDVGENDVDNPHPLLDDSNCKLITGLRIHGGGGSEDSGEGVNLAGPHVLDEDSRQDGATRQYLPAAKSLLSSSSGLAISGKNGRTKHRAGSLTQSTEDNFDSVKSSTTANAVSKSTLRTSTAESDLLRTDSKNPLLPTISKISTISLEHDDARFPKSRSSGMGPATLKWYHYLARWRAFRQSLQTKFQTMKDKVTVEKPTGGLETDYGRKSKFSEDFSKEMPGTML